jgi:hypothetical protein
MIDEHSFARYFGSGVIVSMLHSYLLFDNMLMFLQIGTAFIHLLAHALEALESPCLSEAWGNYVCKIPH